MFLVSVALVAAAIVVPYSVASISLLGTSEETLIGSRIDNGPLDDKVVGTAVSHSDSNTSPVPLETKSPSSSDADNMPSSTPVPPPSDTPGEEAVAEPPLKLTPDRVVSAAAIETSHGSAPRPSTDETRPPELTGSQEVIAQPLSTADEASTAQHASGATMPTLGTSDEQRDQMSQDFGIQRNHHANLDEGSAAFIPPEETQAKESTGFYGSAAASPGAHQPLPRAASRRRGAVEADRDNIAKKLNRAELSRLLEAKRALSRAPFR